MNKAKTPTLKMRVWAAVRNHPGMTAGEVIKLFPEEIPSSLTSILSHLDLNDLVYSTGNGYSNDPKKYFTNLEKMEDVKTALKRSAPVRKTTTALVTPIKGEPALVQEAATTASSRTEQVFNTLALPEAIALYQKLHDVFGGTVLRKAG